MNAKQLRDSILQQAIQGKLVPQDPCEESAIVLLNKIREDKERKFKSGILKKEKELKPVLDEEIPFNIPSSWKWVRLGDYCEKITDYVASGSFATLRENVPVLKDSGYAIMVKTADFSNNFTSNLTYTTKEGYEFLSNSNLFGGELIITNIGATLGKVSVVPFLDMKMTLAPNSVMIRLVDDEHRDFLRLLLSSPFGYDEMKSISSGTAMKKFNKTDLKTILIPVPPLSEQKRIVAKVEEILPLIEKYGEAQAELDELNHNLPRQIRLSVLENAISGKLVTQIEGDISVCDLVDTLISAKKNSGQKKITLGASISEDEIPFDVPGSWTWLRLGDIVYNQTGLAYSKGDLEKKVSNPIRVLRGGNIQSGSWCTKVDDVMIAPEFVKKDIFLQKNTFITPAVTSLEHLGKTALIREDHPDIVAGGFVLYLIPYYRENDTFVEYLSYFFQSAFYNKFCKTITNKSGQAFWNISRQKLMELPIPLPPLDEQKRIVAKIEELFAEIDKLK